MKRYTYKEYAEKRADNSFRRAMLDAVAAGWSFDECVAELATVWEEYKGFAAWKDEDEDE